MIFHILNFTVSINKNPNHANEKAYYDHYYNEIQESQDNLLYKTGLMNYYQK